MALTTHADLYDFNIQKSLEIFVRASTDFVTLYPELLFEDSQFQPEADQWFEFVWVDFGPTIFSKNTFHVRCYSRSIRDRYGRLREKMIGDVRNLLSVAEGITFYDVMNHPEDYMDHPIKFEDDDITNPVQMAIRFAGRGPLLSGEEMGESSQLQGVHLVVLSFDAHVAREHVQW